MGDPRFDYPHVVASKVIVRQDNSILLTQEPLDHDWMPGRWGLPGGKFLLNEGVIAGTNRKMAEEAGIEYELLGLRKIVDILMPKRTVYHFVFVAKWTSGELDLRGKFSSGLKWVPRKELLALARDELTEHYYPELFREFWQNPDWFVPLDFIKELHSYRDPEIQGWMDRGSNKEKLS